MRLTLVHGPLPQFDVWYGMDVQCDVLEMAGCQKVTASSDESLLVECCV